MPQFGRGCSVCDYNAPIKIVAGTGFDQRTHGRRYQPLHLLPASSRKIQTTLEIAQTL
jgi:hypothetical protein